LSSKLEYFIIIIVSYVKRQAQQTLGVIDKGHMLK
jgi:hypothetical protein